MTVEAQVHEHFKLFSGKLNDAGHIGTLADDVAKWVAAKKVAPKSIGIEFIESSKTLILSVGYRTADEEAPYAIKLASTKISKVLELDAGELERLERGLAGAAANQKNVICHELYVTERDELYMVTMSKA